MSENASRRITVLCLLAAAAPAAFGGGCGADRWLKNPPAVEINGNLWRVEVAATVDSRRCGLAGRTSLAEDEGMLFVYPQPEVVEFWMRGCLIPLDLAFIDSNLRVARVYTMTLTPQGEVEKTYKSLTAVQFALEVPAGSLRRAGVQLGQKVTFLGDIPEPAKADPSP